MSDFRRFHSIMLRKYSLQFIFLLVLACFCSLQVFAQSVSSLPYRSQEVSEKDGIPVLIKHLPNWESVRDRAVIANTAEPIKAVLGTRPILDLIDFTGGTEAVTARYDVGRLLIIEYSSPQASVAADKAFMAKLAEGNDSGKTIYRRIGNYNAFVFDAVDEVSANALLDQVKYEKFVQWLGENPFLQKQAERNFIITTSDLFVSTVLIILIGIGIAIFGGVITGYVFFNFRERKRASQPTFSDAGGMTRLNLDGLTPDIIPERLLND